MIIPPKLKKGDEVRVIAPARSLSLLSDKNIKLATEKLEKQEFKITFSENCREVNSFDSSSINSRVSDLHEAFMDKNVKAIFPVIGGFNSNQLLSYLDYDLIKNNPKILCGYSDTTALVNAITAKTGLVTYSGLHFSTWAMRKEFEYNLDYFNKCLVREEFFSIDPSKTWSDDIWYEDQENRKIQKNEGIKIINRGEAVGVIFGGNLCTLNLLQGTEFMPDIKDSIIFVEDDYEVTPQHFDRDLQSLIHQPGFRGVRSLVIGRFQKKTAMTIEKLKYIIKTKKELKNIPVIANVDFGHTNPMITFPIGGMMELKAEDDVYMKVVEH